MIPEVGGVMPGDEVIVEIVKYPTAWMLGTIICLLTGFAIGFWLGRKWDDLKRDRP